MNDIDKGRDFQIFDSLFDNFRLGGKEAHDGIGEEPGHKSKNQACQSRYADAQIQGLTGPFQLPRPPELSHQHAAAADDAHAQNVVQGIKSVGQGTGGQLNFAETAQHDGIHHVDAHVDSLLSCYRQHDSQHVLVEDLILYDGYFLHAQMVPPHGITLLKVYNYIHYTPFMYRYKHSAHIFFIYYLINCLIC